MSYHPEHVNQKQKRLNRLENRNKKKQDYPNRILNTAQVKKVLMKNHKEEQKNFITEENLENEQLNEVYTNIKSIPSFSSKIRDFLRSSEVHSLFKPVRHNFARRRIIAHYPYQIMMSDLMEFPRIDYTKDNNGYKYICILIDVFSKRVDAKPMKRKDAESTSLVLEHMLMSLPTVPKHLITDRGLEYYNYRCDALFSRLGINHYSITSKNKASNVERFIRTLKGMLEKYFWKYKRKRWTNILQQIIFNYNNRPHRSIGMAPNNVNENNRSDVFKTLYPNIHEHRPPRLSVGDTVRILKEKTLFDKGYTRNWSLELYKIKSIFTKSGIDFYRVEDLQKNILPKKKYFWELNLVSKNDT